MTRDVPVSGGSAAHRLPRPGPAAFPTATEGPVADAAGRPGRHGRGCGTPAAFPTATEGPVADAAGRPGRHGRGCGTPAAAGLARRNRSGRRGADLAREPDDAADDDELRRTLLRLIADSGTGVDSRLLGAVDRVRRRMDDALLGATVSATMIDQWEETTAGYGRQYLTVPPLRLLCDALLDFDDVRRMCEQRQPIDFEERLCRLAGQLAS